MKLWAKRDGEATLIAVRDEGPGVKGESVDTVFLPMLRSIQPRGEMDERIGPSLSVVRQLLELHDGSVWVESAPDEGTIFFVRLPNAGPAERPKEL